MMEISEKSSFKFKALVITLITIMLASTCSVSFGYSLFNKKAEDEITLNRKVEFVGETHYKSDGSAKKLSIFKRGETVRHKYSEENPGCGVITMIIKGAKYPYYITGEGYIAEDQIINTERYIQLDINKENGFNTQLHVNGEYVKVESDNTAVANFKDGVISAGIDGKTTIDITTKEGKEIELLAVVANGNMTLNIPEGTMSAEIQEVGISLDDNKLELKGNGDAEAAILIEDGTLAFAADGNGKAELYVKDEKVAECGADGNIQAAANLEGMIAEGTANQSFSSKKLPILNRLSAAVQERAKIEVDKEHAGAEIGGTANINEKEVADGDASINYNYSEEDPTGSVRGNVFGKEVINVENQKLPIISGLKALIAKLRK